MVNVRFTLEANAALRLSNGWREGVRRCRLRASFHATARSSVAINGSQ